MCNQILIIPIEIPFVILVASLIIQTLVTYYYWRIFYIGMIKKYPIPPYLNGMIIKHPVNRKWINFLDKRLILMYLRSTIFFIPSFVGTIIDSKTLSFFYLGIGFILLLIGWIIYNIYEFRRSQKSLLNIKREESITLLERQKTIKIKKKYYQ